jgi:hypothetical protein
LSDTGSVTTAFLDDKSEGILDLVTRAKLLIDWVVAASALALVVLAIVLVGGR